MAVADSNGVITHARTATPTRRLKAAGIIGRHAGRTVTITRTASGTTGTVLPRRTPGASNPPKPTIPPPVAFTTASKAPADLDRLATFQAADFETLWILDETTRPLPADVLDAAYLEAGDLLATEVAFDQVAYELAAGGEEW